MNGFLVVSVLCGTTLSGVVLGVYVAYLVVTSLITACNPSKPRPTLFNLFAHQNHAGGD